MNLKKQISIIAFCLILALAACGGAYGMYNTIRNESGEIVEIQDEIVRAREQEEKSIVTKELVQETSNSRDELGKLILKGDDSEKAAFVERLEGMAEVVNATTTFFGLRQVPLPEGSVGKKGDDGKYEQLTVGIKAEGGWRALLQLLGMLENLPYLSKVDGVVLRRNAPETAVSAKNKKPPTWTLSLTLMVVKYK
jgi:hypothetical protein